MKTKNTKMPAGPTIGKAEATQALNAITEAFENWKNDGDSGCRLKPTKIGEVQGYIEKFLETKSADLESRDIVISSKQLSHMLRDFKVSKGKSVDLSDIVDLISNMKSYQAVFDETHSNFILYKYKNNDEIVKFAIDVNKDMKKYGRCNLVVTAGKVLDALSFWSTGYEIIENKP